MLIWPNLKRKLRPGRKRKTRGHVVDSTAGLVETFIIEEPNRFLIRSAKFQQEWVDATKTLPMRFWHRPFWIVPRHASTISELLALYQKFGNVHTKYKEGMISAGNVKQKYPFLYPFQAEAAAMAVNAGSFLIAHQPGCGKTLTTFAAARELAGPNDLDILVVCPASIMKQWQAEIAKWFNTPSLLVVGNKKKRKLCWNFWAKVKIVSYETLRQDFDEISGDLEQCVVIADECSKIKNRSQITKVFQKMSKIVPHRIAASGTPISGKLEHYYRIMTCWVEPAWMNYHHFDENYTVKDDVCVGRDENGEPEFKNVVVGYRNLDDFVRRLSGYVDRKRKDEIGVQLPKRIIEWRQVASTVRQKRLESDILDYAKEEGHGILPVFSLLHTLDCGTDILLESTSPTLQEIELSDRTPEESNKITELGAILEEIGPEEQVLIYSQYTRFAKRVVAYLNKKFGQCAALATAEDTKARDAAVAEFKEKKLRILVSTDTLAMGVDFPTVNYQIQMDIPADLSVCLQRIDRIHRLNSPVENPKVIILLYGEGVEETLYEILQQKAILQEQVLEGGILEKIDIHQEVAKRYGLI